MALGSPWALAQSAPAPVIATPAPQPATAAQKAEVISAIKSAQDQLQPAPKPAAPAPAAPDPAPPAAVLAPAVGAPVEAAVTPVAPAIAPLPAVPAPIIPVIPAPEATAPAMPAPEAPASPKVQPITTVPGMPPVVNPANIYSETKPTDLSPAVANALPRVYVPHLHSHDLWVIDPATDKVIDKFPLGRDLQHVVPSYDLKTLWITASQHSRYKLGGMIAIDPTTGHPVKTTEMPDVYNLYFTPDGTSAIIVVENSNRLDFRDPHTLKFQKSIRVPACKGINHADFSADGTYAIFTCEFSGQLVKIDMVNDKVLGFLTLNHPAPEGFVHLTANKVIRTPLCALNSKGMPQDIRLAPDGKTFYVADMMSDGVTLIDGESFKQVGFIPTGVATHGLYPSRDGTELYVTNRGSHLVDGPPHGDGSISVINFALRKLVATWPIPGGGSPDMGNVSADGKHLWISGRFDDVVYDIDTTTGHITSIPVGKMPHGLTIWPQPGRYSLGHTGIMR
ncbi:MAG: YncE family protein [Hyphomicrobiales bacterium]|nr:YncE family protein [Hyphomicrobiales bacterium]